MDIFLELFSNLTNILMLKKYVITSKYRVENVY